MYMGPGVLSNDRMMRQFLQFLTCVCLVMIVQVEVRSQKAELIVQEGHTEKGLTGKFALAGKLIVTAGQDHALKLWSTETGTLLKTFTGLNPAGVDTEYSVRISPDGKRAAAVDFSNRIRILNLETGSELQPLAATLEAERGPKASLAPNAGAIHDLIFSSDGQHVYALVSVLSKGQASYAIHGWDLDSGKSVGHALESGDVEPTFFSPDANLLLGYSICSGESKLTVINTWDTASGRTAFRRSYPGCSDVKINPDGKLLVLHGHEKITLLNARTGQALSTIDVIGKLGDVAISHDGKLLSGKVEIGQGKTSLTQLVIWEVASGGITRQLSLGTGYLNDISFVWSPDNSMIACKMQTDGMSSSGVVQVWNVPSGNRVREFQLSKDELGRFLGPPLDWSPDGKYLVTFGDDGATYLWDPETGKKVHTLAGQSRSTDLVAYSPDGNYFVSEKESRRQSEDLRAGLSIWDLKGGALLSRIKGQFKTFSRDSKFVVTETKVQDRGFTATSMYADVQAKEDETNLWTLNGGTAVATLPGRFLFLSADNQRMITRSRDKGVILWDTEKKVPINTLTTFHDDTSFAVVSEDGAYLASGWNNGQTINLIDVSSGRTLRSLTGFPTQEDDPTEYDTPGYSAVFSHDNKLLACRRGWLENGETLLIWDVTTGALLNKFKAGRGLSPSLTFSPDNRTLVSMADDVTFFDVQTGKERKNLLNVADSFYEVMKTVDMNTKSFYSPDGSFFVTVTIGDDLDVQVFDLRNNRGLPYLSDRSFRAAAFSPDNKTMALVGQDNSIQFWDLHAGRLLITALDLDQDGWLTIAPDGRFDGTAGAWQKIFWRFTANIMDILPVEVFFGDFYYPSLLSDILSGRSTSFTQNLSAKDRRQPQLKLTLADAQTDTTLNARTVTAKIYVTQAPAGAQDVRLFRNGSLVRVWRGDVLGGQSQVTLEATVQIVAGENRLTAYAFNHDNIKSADASIIINGADGLKHAGTLYVLGIGSNKYQNPAYDLQFALADVDEISRQVKTCQDGLRNYARTEIISLTDQEATKANIMLALRGFADRSPMKLPPGISWALKQQLEKIKDIEPEDGLVIYYAGHGTAIGEHFYLLPHDFIAKNEALLEASSISDLELDEALARVDASKLLMIIDACQSGQALGGEKEGRGPMNSKGLAQLAYDKGMYILTAAQSYQAAREVSRTQTGKQIQHGLLTFALLEGLTKAKKDNDGKISEREWMNYAVEQVPLMQIEEMKKRSVVIEQGGRPKSPSAASRKGAPGQRGAQLVFIDGDNARADPEKRNVQRPRVFYRRELEAQPLIVARP
ncbi:MAG: hypothetical protein JWM21_4212 [Acidobacteria bacterium]|nr:hypothetical protein [Acidobacteriota bacterium]